MSTAEYRKEKYDNMSFKVPKGKGSEYKQAAEDLGIAQSEMIRLAVEEFIQTHLNEFAPVVKPVPMTPQPTAEKLTSTEKNLLDEFNRLSVDAQKALLKFLKTLNEQ